MGLVIQKGVGAVIPKLLDKRGRVYSNGIILGAGATTNHLFRGKSADYLGYFGCGQLQRGYSAISGKCILFRRENFLAIDGVNTEFGSEEYAWIDFCLRLRQRDLRNIICPSVRLRLTTKQFDERREVASPFDERLLLAKWGDSRLNDPAFNPNLTLRHGRIDIDLDRKNYD